MRIAGAYLRDFEPFADQAVSFGRKLDAQLADVHFFVGQNGTGKTRLLSLIAAACGNTAELTNRTDSASSIVVGESAFNDKEQLVAFQPSHHAVVPLNMKLEAYLTKVASERTIGAAYATVVAGPAMAFRSIPSLYDQPVTPMAAVDWPERKQFLTFAHHAAESKQLCQALANLKIRVGIVAADPADRAVKLAHAFDKTIQTITGQSLITTVGYVGKEFRLKVSWAGKELQLKQLPDGLRAICGWLASCVCKLDVLFPEIENPLEQPLILLLDEPDAYLHPAWQRQLIPAIQKLLPNAQIFVATHSPFVVSSVNAGWIYVFEADAAGKVRISEPKTCSKGDSYIDVVEDVLGIRERFDPETEDLLKVFRSRRDAVKRDRSSEGVEQLREMAKSIGSRGDELKFMMGREMAQLERQLQEAI